MPEFVKNLSANDIISRDTSVAQNIGSMDVLTIDFEAIFLKNEAKLKSITNVYFEEEKDTLAMALLALKNELVVDERQLKILKQAEVYEQIKLQVKKNYRFIESYEADIHNVKTTIVEDLKRNKLAILVGARSDILNRCRFFKYNDLAHTSTPTKRNQIQESFVNLLENQIESLAVAIQPLDDLQKRKLNSNNYTFVGMINYKIKTKTNSQNFIKNIHKEKVHIKYFTRGSLDDAHVIAKALNYSIRDSLSAEEVYQLTDFQLSKRLGKVNLFYNMDSRAQVKVIEILQKNKSTVGFFRKDIEDANQLLTADIGITTTSSDSFGKNCANLLIKERDMESISISIHESRKALMNVMKFVKFKITSAISLTFKLLLGLFIINHEPMSAIQLLIQNLLLNAVQFSIISDNLDNRYVEQPVK